jgi:4-amino-4-deoxy-L-arabinose transferase-like glycosyltransferase
MNLSFSGMLFQGRGWYPMQNVRSFYAPALLAVAILLSFYRLGSVSLFDVDEAVFSEATKEMVLSGDWITPTYNGANRYDKPILFYWLMAASYHIFGMNEFGARFPSAFTGALLSLSIFLFVRRYAGRETALHAAMSFVVSLYFFVYSRAAVTDMALTLLITLSLFFFFLWLYGTRGTAGKGPRYLYGFYLCSALAFLTKGLIGIVFPFCIAATYMVIKKGPQGIRKLFSAKAALLFLLVSGPWYLAEFAVNGKDFLDQFFIKHHFMRYTGVISGHRGPFFYYLPALIIGLFPWIVYLPAGIRNALRSNRAPAVSTDSAERGCGETLPAAGSPPLGLFALVWLGLIFAFFSFSTTKLPNYILPAVPAASILIGYGMAGHLPRGNRYAHGCMSFVALLAGAAFVASRGYLHKFGVADAGWTSVAAVLMFLLAAVSAYAAVRNRRPHGYIAALLIAFFLLLSVRVLPLVNQKLQGTLYDFSLAAKERLGRGGTLITFGINNPSVVFYSDHMAEKVDNLDELLRLPPGGGKTILIAKARDSQILEASGFNVLSKGEKYALFEKK